MTFDLSRLGSHGEDIYISEHAVMRRPHLVRMGSHIAVDEFFVATTALTLADYIHISTHVSVIGGEKGKLVMGNFTNIATHSSIICGSDRFLGAGLIAAPHIPEEYRDELIIEPVVFEDFANIGANVTILPGVVLPEGVVIGACSLVRKTDTLKPWTIYGGNPLREIKARPKEPMKSFAMKIDSKYCSRI